ncbi:MAG: hypothetical protein QXY40_04910 [Candidatus Methanomethylicia archaeon]
MLKKIIDTWKREISSDEIIRIENELLEHIIDYFKTSSLKINDPNTTALQHKLTTEEINLAIKILNNFYKFRRSKVFLEIIDEETLNVNAISMPEKEFYLEILDKLKTEFINLEEQVKISIGDKELTTVRFISSIPQFLGIDLRTYGPYEVEDVAAIPRRNAIILSQKGICIILK